MIDSSNEFSREVCRQMGISSLFETMAVVPTFFKENNTLVLDLIEAKRVKTEIDVNYYALPTFQFEAEMKELEEEDEEWEKDE